MTRTAAHHGEGGFTLMEVLVAMTLLALLMVALSGSIAFVGRSWDKGWRTSESSAALSRVEGTVRQLIERSFPVSARRDKKDEFLFDGTADSLRLVAYSAPGGVGGSLYVQEIVATGAGGRAPIGLPTVSISGQWHRTGPGQRGTVAGWQPEDCILVTTDRRSRRCSRAGSRAGQLTGHCRI